MKHRITRIISLLLCLVMVAGVMPLSVFAAGETKYTVKISVGSIQNNGKTSGEFAAGEKITVKASDMLPADMLPPGVSQSKCTAFDKWKVSGAAVTLSDVNKSEASFTMPAGDVWLYAQYTVEHDRDAKGVCKNCGDGKYKVTKGAGTKWTKGGQTGLSFTVSGEKKNFTGITVDSRRLVEGVDYTVSSSSGATVVKLSVSSLNTMTDGEHVITFKYKDGICDAKYTVAAAPELKSKVITSIVMEVSEELPKVDGDLYYPTLVSINERTDSKALDLLDDFYAAWYCAETYSTNSSAYDTYANMYNKFEAGYAYNLYTNLSAAVGSSFGEKCTFTIQTPKGKLTGVRYNSNNEETNIGFDVFFDVLTKDTTTTTTTTTTTAAATTTATAVTSGTDATASTTATTAATTTTTTTTTTTKPTTASTSVNRLAGDDRYLTAIEISRDGWDKSDTVIIASGENYPDALAGTVLAKVRNAPVLLTQKNSINAKVLEEIRRLGAKNVILLGGKTVISEQISDDLAKSFAVTRVGGVDRSDTAALIAAQVTDKSDIVFLVSSRNFPDALSAGSAAAAIGAPILYVNPDGTVPERTAEAIKALGSTKAYIIGGVNAIDPKVNAELQDLGVTASKRLAGNDRYETAIAVYNEFGKKFKAGSVAVATGKNFPDALAGVALAARNGAPLFLVGDTAHNALIAGFPLMNINTLYVFGGKNVVSESVVDSLVK